MNFNLISTKKTIFLNTTKISIYKNNIKRYNFTESFKSKKLNNLTLKMLLLNRYLALKPQNTNNYFPKEINKFKIYKSLKTLFIKEKTKSIVLKLTKKLSINAKVSSSTNSLDNYNMLYNHVKKTIENNILSSTAKNKYGIIRVHCGFSNLNISLTTLDGKIIQWISAGSDKTQTKRTRMSSRAVGALLIRFFSTYKKKSDIRYIKVVFSGPSTKFRGKFLSIIKSWSRSLRFNVICIEEAFHRSFNGCRLARKKR